MRTAPVKESIDTSGYDALAVGEQLTICMSRVSAT